MDPSQLLDVVRQEAGKAPGKAGRPWEKAALAMDRYLKLRLGEAVRGPSRGAHSFAPGISASQEKGTVADSFGRNVQVAVVALGGYGRKELCPRSDVDILLLVQENAQSAEAVERIAGHILHPLWDEGFEVGHGVRTVRECIELARDDLAAATAHLDARYIAGSRKLFTELNTALGRDAARRCDTLADALRQAAAERAADYGDAAMLMAPDLKNGRGGLRDVQTLFWLLKLYPEGAANGHPLREFFGVEDCAELESARKALLRARCALQRLARSKRNRLVLDEAPDYARACGITTEDPARAGERFIAMVHEAAYVVRAGWVQFWRVWESSSTAVRHQEDLRPSELLFFAASTGEPLTLAQRRRIRHALAGGGAKDFEPVLERLPGIMATPGCMVFLEECFETGVLGALIPEFGRMQALVQYDGFHTHTQGRHALETVREMRGLLGDNADSEPPAADMPADWLAELVGRALEAYSPEEFAMAALLHDVGKPHPDHEAEGERIVAAIMERRDESVEVAERIRFLVGNHLLLSLTALREDLAEESVIAKIAAQVGSREHLAALMLLTIADARATGPTAWNAWLASLLRELVDMVDHMLAVGPLAAPHAAQALMSARDKVRQEAKGRFEPADVERWLDRMPPRYLLTRDAAEIVRHMEEIERLKADLAEDFRRKPSGRGGLGVNRILAEPAGQGLYRITLFAQDAPGLFATFTGAMALQQLVLHAADVFTLADGTAVDIFTVGGMPDALYPEEVFSRLSAHIREASAGRLDLAYRLAERRTSPLAPPEPTGIPCLAVLKHELSRVYTVIEVSVPARYGVLYDMACALRDADVDVCQAKLALRGPELTVAFSVREQNGGMLDPKQADAAAAALCHAVEGVGAPATHPPS